MDGIYAANEAEVGHGGYIYIYIYIYTHSSKHCCVGASVFGGCVRGACGWGVLVPELMGPRSPRSIKAKGLGLGIYGGGGGIEFRVLGDRIRGRFKILTLSFRSLFLREPELGFRRVHFKGAP